MTAAARRVGLRYVAHADANGGRRVTWLELFFDLVFAGAVAQVASPLRDDYSIAGLGRFSLLFILIWWAWIGHAVFATRFDSDDRTQRALTLLQMFGVAVMAANAGDALDSRSSAGFAAAYAAQRFVLVFQYFRARRVAQARDLSELYCAGHGLAAVLWLVSALVSTPARYLIWAAAFAIDLGTPWAALRHSVAAPPDAAHLPERFGLFTLILLGESVISVTHGIEHQEYWTVPAAAGATGAMGLVFLIWWCYFDAARAAAHRPVRVRKDAVSLHIWSYTHLPLYLGLVVAFAGIERIVSEAPVLALAGVQLGILGGALAAVALALFIVAAAGARSVRQPLEAGGA